MDVTSNQFSHIAWIKGDIPRDRDGEYLVWLDRPSLGSRIAVCRVRKVASGNPKKAFGLLVTINSNFEFDCGDLKILAWVNSSDLGPMEE